MDDKSPFLLFFDKWGNFASVVGLCSRCNMDVNKFREFVNRVIRATQSGALTWQTTPDEHIFRLILNAGIIHVRGYQDQAVPGDPIQRRDIYELVFLDRNSVPTEGWYPDQETDLKQLRDLWEAARKSAMKPSDELFRRLDQEVIQRSG